MQKIIEKTVNDWNEFYEFLLALVNQGFDIRKINFKFEPDGKTAVLEKDDAGNYFLTIRR